MIRDNWSAPHAPLRSSWNTGRLLAAAKPAKCCQRKRQRQQATGWHGIIDLLPNHKPQPSPTRHNQRTASATPSAIRCASAADKLAAR